jgi:hypothetical protein
MATMRDTVGWLYAVKERHLGPRLAPGDDTFGDFPSLGVIEFLSPSADTPLRPGGG